MRVCRWLPRHQSNPPSAPAPPTQPLHHWRPPGATVAIRRRRSPSVARSALFPFILWCRSLSPIMVYFWKMYLRKQRSAAAEMRRSFYYALWPCCGLLFVFFLFFVRFCGRDTPFVAQPLIIPEIRQSRGQKPSDRQLKYIQMCGQTAGFIASSRT